MVHPSIDYAHFSPMLPIGFVKPWDSVRISPRLRAQVELTDFGAWRVTLVDVSQPTDPAPLNIITSALWDLLNREPRGDDPTIFDAVRVIARVTSGPRSGQEGHFWLGRENPRGALLLDGDNVIRGRTFTFVRRDDDHWRIVQLGLAEIDSSHPDYMPLDSDIEGESVEFYVEAADPSGPSEDLPLYVDDVNPITYIRDILDGKFGPLDDDGTPQVTFPYNDANLTEFENDASLPDLRFIERERVKAIEKIEEICRSVGLGWRLNDSGEFELVDLRLPQTFDLPIIDADDVTTDAPDWEVDRDSALSQIQVVYQQDRVVSNNEIEQSSSEFPDVPGGAIETREQTFLKIDVSNPALLQGRPHEIRASGFRYTVSATETVNGVLRQRWIEGQLNTLTEHYRIPYGAGAPRVKLQCRRTTPVESCRVGDLRLVDLDDLPNASLHERGGTRLMRCVGRWVQGPTIQLEFLDQALAQQAEKPTLGTPSCGATPGDVDVPVTMPASGEPVALYFAAVDEGADKPGETSFAWIFSHRVETTGTHTIPGVAGANRIYVRARTEPDAGSDQGAPSDWVSPVGQEWVECGELVAPTNCSAISPTAVEVRLTWENTSFNRIAILFEGAVQSYGLDPGTTSFQILNTYLASNESTETTDLEPDTEYTFQIGYIDELGNIGPTCGGTVTTADFTPRAPDLLGIRLLIGENVEII